MDEKTATALSKLYEGSSAWNSGGGIWLVTIEKPNGHIVVMGDESIAEYASIDGLLTGDGLISEIDLY